MKMKLASLLALSAATAISACAPTASDGSDTGSRSVRQCFNSDQVRGFSVPQRDVIQLQVDGRRTFEAEVVGVCTDLQTSISIAVVPDRGSNWICAGDWARIVTPSSPTNFGPCRVRITKQIVAEVPTGELEPKTAGPEDAPAA